MSTSMVMRTFKHSNAPLRRIEKVQFGVLSEHEIVSRVHAVTAPHTLLFTF